MAIPAAVRDLFQAVDAMDASRFVTHLTPDGIFRFGNWPAVAGQDATRAAVGQFFDTIRGLRHTLLGTWSDGDRLFCQGEVIYTRHDGSTVGPLPFFNVFRMVDGKIAEYLIYADVSPLYQAQA